MRHRSPIMLLVSVGLMFVGLVALLAAESTNTPHALAGQLATLTVRATGFRNDRGIAQIALFRNALGFPDHAELAFRTNTMVITNGQVSVDFIGIPFGDYAASVLHDENCSGRMDTNWVGMPREGYGVSNDARGKTGTPSFVAARFKLETATCSLSVNLSY